MPLPNAKARQGLLDLLRQGPISTGDLVQRLGVSAPSVHRMLREIAGDVVSAGKTNQRRHALRRSLPGTGASLPVFAIDELGRISGTGSIELIARQGCLAAMDVAWPQVDGGWWEGLPYPLYDMRPQGYLGRLVARAMAQQLRVPEDPNEWGDDDVLTYLVQFGSDQSGNLIVGETAMKAWSRDRSRGLVNMISEDNIAKAFVTLAEAALGSGGAGSSAGGEFPKFTAARALNGSLTPHVIVKFSGSDDSPAVRRWSDLLVCEHLALQALSEIGKLSVARSRVIKHAGRTFLESERFDRHGDFGRSPVVTLGSVNAALIGSPETGWLTALCAPAAIKLFTTAAINIAEEQYWFGRFIANTDMHSGNLGLRPVAGASGGAFKIAPAYDMLPMQYAPLRGGEVPARDFDPSGFPPPPADREHDWQRILQAAVTFWNAAAADDRITQDFRRLCAENGQALQRWSGIWDQRPVDRIADAKEKRPRE
jgi:hypothetical protein